jgi:hypothetical protein
MQAEIIEERFFYGCGSVPEWGLRYPSGKMILFEYSTEDNFSRQYVMFGKLNAYKNHLETINRRFDSSGIVVFVCDVPKPKLETLIDRVRPTSLPIFFTDMDTFQSVPISQQLTAPIYLWGEDGKTYPLVQHAQP